MKASLALSLLAASIGVCLAQTSGTGGNAPTDPKILLISASPLYRLTDAGQHPWYLKATYQLFDDQDKPSEQGTYEYWWSAPGRYRASWSRKSADASIWVTGNAAALSTGHPELLGFPEGLVGMALVPALPAPKDIAKFGLNFVPLNLGGTQLRCVRLAPEPLPVNDGSEIAPVPRFSGLCMDPARPILRLLTSENGEMVVYEDLEPFDGQYVARHVAFNRGRLSSFDRGNFRKWDARVVEIKEIDGNDQAFIPPSKAKPLQASIPESNYSSLQPKLNASDGSIDRSIFVSEEVASGLMKNHIQPVFPAGLDAKRFAHSKVVFQVIVSGSGKVRFAKAISGPPELQEAALHALLQYEYRPFHTTSWEPMEIETKVTVKF